MRPRKDIGADTVWNCDEVPQQQAVLFRKRIRATGNIDAPAGTTNPVAGFVKGAVVQVMFGSANPTSRYVLERFRS
jgi:hypothetical protein